MSSAGGAWFTSVPGKEHLEAPAIWMQEAEATEICLLMEEICRWQRCLPSLQKKYQEVKLLHIRGLDMEQETWVRLFRVEMHSQQRVLLKVYVYLCRASKQYIKASGRSILHFKMDWPKDKLNIRAFMSFHRTFQSYNNSFHLNMIFFYKMHNTSPTLLSTEKF